MVQACKVKLNLNTRKMYEETTFWDIDGESWTELFQDQKSLPNNELSTLKGNQRPLIIA